MKRETAERLLKDYSEALAAHGPTFSGLWDRWQALSPPGDDAKLMRWLGFAQGACVALGVYTLTEVIRHSKQAVEAE